MAEKDAEEEPGSVIYFAENCSGRETSQQWRRSAVYNNLNSKWSQTRINRSRYYYHRRLVNESDLALVESTRIHSLQTSDPCLHLRPKQNVITTNEDTAHLCPEISICPIVGGLAHHTARNKLIIRLTVLLLTNMPNYFQTNATILMYYT